MSDWQSELKNLVRDPDELLHLLSLDHDDNLRGRLMRASQQFPLRVTRDFVSQMKVADPNDPLLRQILPVLDETEIVNGYTEEPLKETAGYIPTRGLVHKYNKRALFMVTGACAINCRYCFRRHFPYAEQVISDSAVEALLERVEYESLSEVILSGGDPLMLPTDKLSRLVDRLLSIPSVTTLRVHSRLPIVLPGRLDQEFIRWWNAIPLKKVIVIHANHANEFSVKHERAFSQLTNTQLLNQAVLLRGVNDNSEAIINLSETCFDYGVLPYYLHMLDKVSGAAHFNVPEVDALDIINEVRNRLPGYLVPRLVREEAGALSKTFIA